MANAEALSWECACLVRESEIMRLERWRSQSMGKLEFRYYPQCSEKACWNFIVTLGKSIPLWALVTIICELGEGGPLGPEFLWTF